jgi:hypothetical protein
MGTNFSSLESFETFGKSLHPVKGAQMELIDAKKYSISKSRGTVRLKDRTIVTYVL